MEFNRNKKNGKMKKFFGKVVVWDMFVAVFLANSIVTLLIYSYTENVYNNEVVASIIHALVIMYGYTYFKNRKPY